MAWEFCTEPEFQEKLDWVERIVREEIEPLDYAFPGEAFLPPTPEMRPLISDLKKRVKDKGLWAMHLEPELGGQGFGQLKLALMNEIVGRSAWAPVIFGIQAPDTGNAEIIAKYGSEEQKKKFLQPLLEGEMFSAFSMTEPTGGADPTLFRCRAERDGDEWVITGEKYFTSNANGATFFVVMAVTNPDVSAYKGMSMFLVEADSPGIRILRDVHAGLQTGHEGRGRGGMSHPHIRYEAVRVPSENLLGGEGNAFVVAQTRLGGGRIHHAMRTIAQCKRAFDMMCERAVSRSTASGLLGEKQAVQSMIAQSYAEIEMLRLLVLKTAWDIDNSSTAEVRVEIAACKVACAKVLKDVLWRAVHLHGAMGVSSDMPLVGMWAMAPAESVMDGPDEVHQATIARGVLKQYKPHDEVFPSEFLPAKVAAAKEKYAAYLVGGPTFSRPPG